MRHPQDTVQLEESIALRIASGGPHPMTISERDLVQEPPNIGISQHGFKSTANVLRQLSQPSGPPGSRRMANMAAGSGVLACVRGSNGPIFAATPAAALYLNPKV
jgi:hypothetical protein